MKHLKNKELKERLVINHIIILVNVFGVDVRYYFTVLQDREKSLTLLLKTFLIYSTLYA